MKKIIKISLYIALLSMSNMMHSQIAIGKTSVTNSSVLLEFGTGNKGIILPSVQSINGNTPGAFVFNTSSKAVQVWEQRNANGTGGWLNLTELNAGVLHSFSNSASDSTSNVGVIIGASTTTKAGTLVLESTTRALVLPIVSNPQSTMIGSVAGTMVYDATSSTMAVFDGAQWNYWK